MRQLLAQGLLEVAGEYGLLAVTETAADVLRGEREVLLRREPKRVRAARTHVSVCDISGLVGQVVETLGGSGELLGLCHSPAARSASSAGVVRRVIGSRSRAGGFAARCDCRRR